MTSSVRAIPLILTHFYAVVWFAVVCHIRALCLNCWTVHTPTRERRDLGVKPRSQNVQFRFAAATWRIKESYSAFFQTTLVILKV